MTSRDANEVPDVAPAALARPLTLAEEVRRDLLLEPRQLQSKYLYDALGSALFDAICQLPWYSIWRAEHRLLSARAATLATMVPRPLTIIELGCGSGDKLATLVGAFGTRGDAVRVHLIDISATALEQTAQRLRRFDHVSVCGHRSVYEIGLRQAAAARRPGDLLLVLFLGSNIGNFDPEAADAFLAGIRAALRPGDILLLGADLVKPERELVLAYDDPLGVTAAFNKNLLVRVNAELGADFDLDAFAHRAVWNAACSRVEMHLVATAERMVHVPAAGLDLRFEPGQWIWTESSYKYEPDDIVSMGELAGFRAAHQWIDEPARFALTSLHAR